MFRVRLTSAFLGTDPAKLPKTGRREAASSEHVAEGFRADGLVQGPWCRAKLPPSSGELKPIHLWPKRDWRAAAQEVSLPDRQVEAGPSGQAAVGRDIDPPLPTL